MVNTFPIKGNLDSLSYSMAPLPFTRHSIVIPSIFAPGPFFRKNVVSTHEVICEQWVLPSHLPRLPPGYNQVRAHVETILSDLLSLTQRIGLDRQRLSLRFWLQNHLQPVAAADYLASEIMVGFSEIVVVKCAHRCFSLFSKFAGQRCFRFFVS